MAQPATPTSEVAVVGMATGMGPGDGGIQTPTRRGDREIMRWGQ